jgi:alkylation response protein AidB-like acyl-CoA dehydrogenase
MALGIASAAIEAFRALGATKRQADGSLLSTAPLAAMALDRAELQLAQARGHLYETVETMWEEIGDGHFPGEEWLGRTALASVNAVDAAIDIVSAIYRAAGSSAVSRARPFDRCLRDLFTLGAHKTVQHANLFQYRGLGFAANAAVSAQGAVDSVA